MGGRGSCLCIRNCFSQSKPFLTSLFDHNNIYSFYSNHFSRICDENIFYRIFGSKISTRIASKKVLPFYSVRVSLTGNIYRSKVVMLDKFYLVVSLEFLIISILFVKNVCKRFFMKNTNELFSITYIPILYTNSWQERPWSALYLFFYTFFYINFILFELF